MNRASLSTPSRPRLVREWPRGVALVRLPEAYRRHCCQRARSVPRRVRRWQQPTTPPNQQLLIIYVACVIPSSREGACEVLPDVPAQRMRQTQTRVGLTPTPPTPVAGTRAKRWLLAHLCTSALHSQTYCRLAARAPHSRRRRTVVCWSGGPHNSRARCRGSFAT